MCEPQSPMITGLETPFKGAEVKESCILWAWVFQRLVPPEMTLPALILLRGDCLAAAAALVPGTAPGALSSSPGWGIQWFILTSPATLQLSLAFYRPPRVPLQAI